MTHAATVHSEISDEIEIIANRIDTVYYSSAAKIAGNAYDCAKHYVDFGVELGLNPKIDFDTVFYLNMCRDVASSGINPFYHYIIWGEKEGRLPHAGAAPVQMPDMDQEIYDIISDSFDRSYYRAMYSGSVDSSVDPVRHYMYFGWSQKLNPNHDFDTAFYLDQNADVAQSGVNPFYHYLRWGKYEGRKGHLNESPKFMHPDTEIVQPHFDSNYYHDLYLKSHKNGIDALQHFLYFGWRQGFNPSGNFSMSKFIAENADKTFDDINPFVYYLQRQDIRKTTTSGTSTDEIENTILSSGLFDEFWYRTKYGEFLEARETPLKHYLSKGENINFKPNMIFDPLWYRSNYMEEDANSNALHHFVTVGRLKDHDPGETFSTEAYFEKYRSVKEAGMIALSHYLEHGIKAGLSIDPSRLRRKTLRDLINEATSDIKPLRVNVCTSVKSRVNIITDSVNQGSLFGGVGTALILAVLIAKKKNLDLCIMTTTERAFAPSISEILAANRISFDGRVIFRHVGLGSFDNLFDVSDQDLFITTSWWTTASTLKSVPKNRIIYILQEDERMFYEFGDRRLRASELISTDGLLKVINTKLLYEHLTTTGFDKIQQDSIWFEPSFLTAGNVSINEKERMNLFFYARPYNSRNLFVRGLEALEHAIFTNKISADHWKLHVVGKDLPQPFPFVGLPVQVHSGLNWHDYSLLMSDMDLGLSLMYTPHPSYPPLDLAVRGGVCVTNSFGLKTRLDEYSKNIICANTDVESLAHALGQGAILARNIDARYSNFREQAICQNWNESLQRTIEFIGKRGML